MGAGAARQLAARGRARSVVALAPAGGWAERDRAFEETLVGHFEAMHEGVRASAPHAEAILSTEQGRRRATESIVSRFEHIPVELLAHLMLGAAGCDAVGPLHEHALRAGWRLDAERITCPVRVVRGTEDKLLTFPSAAARFLDNWLPHADWIELHGVGHCPQLDVPLETAQLIVGFTAR